MSALGEAFRTAREARGLSLSEVADHTHIRSVYLAAIEAEDWASIGAPVYARGFIRTYARFLGLDADDAVKRFSERVPGASSPVAAPVAPAPIPAPGTSTARGGPSVLVIALGLIALVLVAFVGYEYIQYQSGSSPSVPVAAASPATPPEAATDSPAPVDEPSAQPAPVPDESMPPADEAARGIAVRLTGRSWLRLTVDGAVKLEGIFPAGTYRLFAGKRADIRAGNAAGVDVTVNGKHLGKMGAAGDVVERSYTL